MTILTRHSERVPPQGAAAGDVAERALGKHQFTPWELLLRETFQNSWDARNDREDGQIGYKVNLYRANSDQCAIMLNRVFADLAAPHAELRKELERNDTDLLVVSDSGTRGLGGPTRGDIRPADGDRGDYADFVLHIGRAAEKEIGGGTFGFGKAVFPLASRHGTCIVYTRALSAGQIENRLIAFAVGQRFQEELSEYTGRHWWGAKGQEDLAHVYPLLGEEAESVARALGMDTMGADRTGTSVAIVGPELYGSSRRDVVEQMSAAAMRWIWPHLVEQADGHGPRAIVSFTADGEELSAPEPMKDPVIQYFARALRDAEEASAKRTPKVGQTSWARPIVMGVGRQVIGSLAVQKYPNVRVPEDEETTHHVALMRSPRLVVQYLEVQKPGPEQALAGVFIAGASLDEIFSKAEPPAHNVWEPQGVVARGITNPVKIALDRVREACAPVEVPADSASGGGNLSGAASIARRLGGFLGGVLGSGAEVEGSSASGGSGGGGGGSRHWRPTPTSMELRRGPTGTEVDFVVPVPARVPSGFVLNAVPRVVTYGGSDETPSIGSDQIAIPEFLGWFDKAGNLISVNPKLAYESLPTGTSVRARLSQPAMTAIRIDLKRERS